VTGAGSDSLVREITRGEKSDLYTGFHVAGLHSPIRDSGFLRRIGGLHRIRSAHLVSDQTEAVELTATPNRGQVICPQVVSGLHWWNG
jgi:hypothetical protein